MSAVKMTLKGYIVVGFTLGFLLAAACLIFVTVAAFASTVGLIFGWDVAWLSSPLPDPVMGVGGFAMTWFASASVLFILTMELWFP